MAFSLTDSGVCRTSFVKQDVRHKIGMASVMTAAEVAKGEPPASVSKHIEIRTTTFHFMREQEDLHSWQLYAKQSLVLFMLPPATRLIRHC
jgi:hypothetical protein